MSAQPWYKHYPTDFINGVIGLGPAEIGAYIIILDLIYDHDRPIANNAKWIGGILGCSPRMATALVNRLVAAQKLVIEDGLIDNFRARKELENRAKTSRKHAEHGASGARNRWSGKQKQPLSDGLAITPAILRARVPEATREETPLNRGFFSVAVPEGGSQPNGESKDTPEEFERRRLKVEEAKRKMEAAAAAAELNS